MKGKASPDRANKQTLGKAQMYLGKGKILEVAIAGMGKQSLLQWQE